METDTEQEQTALFDLSGKTFNINWVDEKQPLFIPNNPLHWRAHKLQILVQRLENQAQKNPAQFNSKNYIDALNELNTLFEEINKRGVSGENLGSPDMAEKREPGTTEIDRSIEPISMDS